MIEEFTKPLIENFNNTIDYMIELVESTKPKKMKRKIRYKKRRFKIQEGMLLNPYHEIILDEVSLFVNLSNAFLKRSE